MGARWEIDRLHAHGFERPVNEVTVAAVDGGAVLRQVTAGPGSAVVSDVSAEGRLLLTRGDVRISLRGQIAEETEEREFPWLDSSISPRFRVTADTSPSRISARARAPTTRWRFAMLPQTRSSALVPAQRSACHLTVAWLRRISHRLRRWCFTHGRRRSHRARPGSNRPDSVRRRVVHEQRAGAVLRSRARQRFPCYAQDVKSGPPVAVTPDDVTDAVSPATTGPC